MKNENLPIAIITKNRDAAIQDLRKHFLDFDNIRSRGTLRNGKPFRIFRLSDHLDYMSMKGYRFSSLFVHGRVSEDLVTLVKIMCENPQPEIETL